MNALNKIPGVKCVSSGGAFYAFPDVRPVIASLHQKNIINEATDVALSEYLLTQAGVAVVPGSAFGSEGYIRLSFATSMANLQNAIARNTTAFS